MDRGERAEVRKNKNENGEWTFACFVNFICFMLVWRDYVSSPQFVRDNRSPCAIRIRSFRSWSFLRIPCAFSPVRAILNRVEGLCARLVLAERTTT